MDIHIFLGKSKMALKYLEHQVVWEFCIFMYWCGYIDRAKSLFAFAHYSICLWRTSYADDNFLFVISFFHLAICFLSLLYIHNHHVEANPNAKMLYNDLLRKSGYNKLIRPVVNNSDILTVKVGLKLSQLIDIVSLFLSYRSHVKKNCKARNFVSLFIFE